MTPERERELALLVARSVANDAGIATIPHIDRNAAALRVTSQDDVAAMPWRTFRDHCDRIAALARTARVTIEIPEET